jgi:hypothetical protein
MDRDSRAVSDGGHVGNVEGEQGRNS